MAKNEADLEPDKAYTAEALEARKKIVLEINGRFAPERCVYMIASILSLGLILFLALDLYSKEKIGVNQLALFIGPSGFLAYAVSRVLFMWSQTLKIIFYGKL